MTGERTEVAEVVGVLQPDLLLVNDDDLTYAKVRLDDRSMATVVERIADIDDGLARALCWSAAWDMTRDAEMPAREYVRLALAGVLRETDIGVVQSIQVRLRGALDRYADPVWAPRGWAQVADLASAGMRSAAPGSDFQLAWARTFASAARTPSTWSCCGTCWQGGNPWQAWSWTPNCAGPSCMVWWPLAPRTNPTSTWSWNATTRHPSAAGGDRSRLARLLRK